MRLAVYVDSRVVVTVPAGMDQSLAEKYVSDKTPWIAEKIAYFQKLPKRMAFTVAGGFQSHKADALALVAAKVKHWNSFYGFELGAIRVRNQKSRWGSCSQKKNLSFNYKIKFLPGALADYLVVHELCHLKELNHSQSFWALVSQTLPDYRSLRREFKNFSL